MQVVTVPKIFPYPYLFLIASRAAGVKAPPVEPVGVLIVKQTVKTNGVIAAQEKILMSDVEYPDPPDTLKPHLDLRLESDLASDKPALDVVAVRDSFEPGVFGNIRINRGTGFSQAMRLSYGWRDRLTEPRKKLAGTDLVNFTPNIADRFKLPTDFMNEFFNGGHLQGMPHLQAGDIVEFQSMEPYVTPVKVTIPNGPTLTVKMHNAPISPPVAIELGVDTVVYDMPAGHFLLTWRGVFAWEDRLNDAVLEVS